jgi:hypothetical protein
VRALTGEELLRLSVRARGIRLGRLVDVLIHPTDPRALGADVLCGDHRHRFLPFPAARLGSRGLEVTSPLALLDLQDDSSYRLEARALSELRGTPVAGSSLQDVVLGPDWAIVEVVLNGSEGPRRVPLDGIVLPPRREGGRASKERRRSR